jgi:hypothetical protein
MAEFYRTQRLAFLLGLAGPARAETVFVESSWAHPVR